MPPDLGRELAALRARAYGPDADIDADPAASARLAELEELARPRPAAPEADALSAAPAAAAAEEVDEVPEGIADAAAAREPARDHRRWWRDWRVGAVGAAALAVGLAVGLGIPPLATPQPNYTVALDPDAPVDPTEAWILQAQRALDVLPGSLRQYEQIEGVTMWTGENSVGSRCLIVVWGELWGNGGCAPGGLDPIVDFRSNPDIPMPLAATLDPGSLVRFIARGDVVEIWIREPAADSAALPVS